MSCRRTGTLVGLWAVAAAAGLVAQAATAGTVKGTATYVGKVPRLKPLSVAAEPKCASKHATVPNEVLVLGEGNTMANVLVRVADGLPSGKTWPTPSEPVVMDQDGCQYKPHVMGVMVDQPFKILNSDGILHNVHALPDVNRPFNMAMPPSRTEAVEKFSKAEGMFRVKCDVHPWMEAYVGVFTHPFFAVTGKDGQFEIGDLPAGTYEIQAWHEKLGTKKATVTVGASGTESVAFEFAPPKR